MGSEREMTRSFIKAFAEICSAREVRMRVQWRGGGQPAIMSDEVYAPDGGARHGAVRDGAALDGAAPRDLQIPMHFGAREASGWRPESSIRGLAMEAAMTARGASIDCEDGAPVETARILLGGEWNLSIERGAGVCRFEGEVHGFRVRLRVVPSDGALLRGRLERAGALLELFRTLIESYGPPCRFPSGGECGGDADLSPPLLGCSPHIGELRNTIRKAARSSIPLLIEGESGTGKEVLARNAHGLGPRSGRPLVILNCLEMPRSLMQSELFGHLKGSFTGATRDRAGLVESASGGTLFLDEIGEMPRSLQAALLRVLQEKEVRRIGESRRRSVDVRFVFATNSDLETLVERGRFRQDLFYRMCGVRLLIPPLRARREDIPLLAGHFLRLAAGERDGGAPHITARAMNRLMSHDWPGNVRELKHEMERVLALYPGERHIRPEMLSPRIAERNAAVPRPERETMQRAVRRLEIGLIEAALERFGNNRTRAAAHLGITRQGLLKKLKRYGIAPRGRAG